MWRDVARCGAMWRDVARAACHTPLQDANRAGVMNAEERAPLEARAAAVALPEHISQDIAPE